MAQMPNIRGHKLKIGKPDKNGKMQGRCSCGGWLGFGDTRDEVQQKWSKSHVSKFYR